MVKSVIAIIGLSGSGKSTVLNKVIKMYGGVNKVISCTTRPQRPNEINKKDYYFISDILYNVMDSCGALIAKEEFKVASGDIWRYGIIEKLLTQYEYPILILTPSGVENLKSLGYNVITFYIDLSEEERFKRIYNRKDNQGDQEIKRRNKEDLERFDSLIYDYKIYNGNSDICAARIVSILDGII